MRYSDSIFARLLKPIDRRRFQKMVDECGGDAYDKSFRSWTHLVALIFAQFSDARSLRELEMALNAHADHRARLGIGPVARSTLSDANLRRPPEVFAGAFAMLGELTDRRIRHEGVELVRLIDTSPIPLGKLYDCATWNGRIRGLKMHVVYDPRLDCPHQVDITSATVNDVEIGRQISIERGVTYVFDKGYCHYGWWTQIHQADAIFVTRPKENARFRARKRRKVRKRIGEGFRVLDDAEITLASKGDSRLPIPLRRIRIRRDNGGVITLITNDRKRTAVEIAALYKERWQIELLFRWLKQHLHIKAFLGRSENAIRLQILAAMIAYILVRLAARLNCVKIPIIRLLELIRHCLFAHKPISRIHSPPAKSPASRLDFASSQISFSYA